MASDLHDRHEAAERALAELVGSATVVDPVGSGTHREVGGPAPSGATPVSAPAGVLAYEPADLTVTVGAGTTVGALDATLAEHDQECALDPADRAATVGGTIAVGLSGPRRLRVGPLRDQVLEVRFASADGRLVRGGGPTVKNVTGYDLPRLLVGSFGTIGVLTRVILRCRPKPMCSRWYSAPTRPDQALSTCLRPSTVMWDGRRTWVLLEGQVRDVEDDAARAGLAVSEAPAFPSAPNRGRISVVPGAIVALGTSLDALPGVAWLSEAGIGTVHVGALDRVGLQACRDAATDAGGWMLREAGAPDLDGFGRTLPNDALAERVRAAFDPEGKLAPGRLPRPLVDLEAR